MDAGPSWIDRNEALTRLGVKAQTLYAYVSRGRIAARADPGHPRRSLYAAADIARLLDGTAAPAPSESRILAAKGEAEVCSAVSLAADGRLFYRGLDAAQMAKTATLEVAARRLWDARDADPFAGLKPRVDPVGGATPRARVFAALARRADEDTGRQGLSPDVLRGEAASVLNEVIDAVSGPGPRLYLHQRLARAWRVAERDADLLRRALVLTAAGSPGQAEVAVRAAVDGGAGLAGAALAGVCALAGSSKLRAATEASAWVITARCDPAGVSRRRFEETGSLPGFGDPDWRCGDPRAAALLEAVDGPADLLAVVREGQALTSERPTLALALAVVARRLDLPRDGAADLMLLGRLTGFLAHALDQAIDGSPIRARVRYVGPEPGAN